MQLSLQLVANMTDIMSMQNETWDVSDAVAVSLFHSGDRDSL
jgi:hypothetical protein